MISCVFAAFVALSAICEAQQPSLPGNVSFDPFVSLEYVYFSFASYCDHTALASWTCGFCVNKNFTYVGSAYDDITQAFGYVGFLESNKTIVVAFEGSETVMNWLTDFDFIKKPYPAFPNASVHEGFNFAWNQLKTQIYGHVNKILAEDCPSCTHVMWAGHSLGAAITGLGVIDMALDYQNVTVGMNNIGMPRIGNPDFAAAFAHYVPNAQRMVHQDDIVPHLPLQEMGFHHVPTEIWDLSPDVAGAPQTFKVCDDSGEDPTCSDSVPAWKWSGENHVWYMGVHDHCP